MTRIDPDDTQPGRNAPERNRRQYIHAEWAPLGGGGGHPKLSGGITVDIKTGEPAPRAWNRPDQRYVQPLSTILANRSTRATSEAASTIVLQGAPNLLEVRGMNGNNYDVSTNLLNCDCPDWWRLDESGYGIVRCKHIYLCMLASSSPGSMLATGWAVSYVASLIGIDDRTVEQLCQNGDITATKVLNCWVIDDGAAPFEIDAYKARLVTFPNATGGDIIT